MEMLLLDGKEQVSLFNLEHNVLEKEDRKIGKQRRNRDVMITNLLLGRMGKTKLLFYNKLWWHQQYF